MNDLQDKLKKQLEGFKDLSQEANAVLNENLLKIDQMEDGPEKKILQSSADALKKAQETNDASGLNDVIKNLKNLANVS